MVMNHSQNIEIGNLELQVYVKETTGFDGDYFSPADGSDFEIESVFSREYNREVLGLLSTEAMEEILRLFKQKLW
jgi:hypothetical protein